MDGGFLSALCFPKLTTFTLRGLVQMNDGACLVQVILAKMYRLTKIVALNYSIFLLKADGSTLFEIETSSNNERAV